MKKRNELVKNVVSLLLLSMCGVCVVTALPTYRDARRHVQNNTSTADGRTGPGQNPPVSIERLFNSHKQKLPSKHDENPHNITELHLETDILGQNADGLKKVTKTNDIREVAYHLLGHRIKKRRQKGDTLSQLKQKLQARRRSKKTPIFIVKNTTNSSSQTEYGSGVRNRKRRWDYEDDYEWEDGGKDYDVPGDESKPDSKWLKVAKNWQKYALKYIFIFSFGMMIFCCCCACCRKICSRTYEIVCWHCKDWRDLCLNRDPAWRKARKFADDYGLELDYTQYKKIKSSYETSLKNQGYGEVDLSGRK